MKVFGIGFPRTGTTSLNAALNILGFRAKHFAHDRATVAAIRRAEYRLAILERYDGLTDIPVPAIFAQLDETYAGSKFVLTVRDMSQWLTSCRNAWFNESAEVPRAGTAREFYRTLLYGCNHFNRARFEWVHRVHLRRVEDHFTGPKSSQILVLDIAGGAGWDELCPFLGVPTPREPFPHWNRSPEFVESPDPTTRTGSLRRLLWR